MTLKPLVIIWTLTNICFSSTNLVLIFSCKLNSRLINNLEVVCPTEKRRAKVNIRNISFLCRYCNTALHASKGIFLGPKPQKLSSLSGKYCSSMTVSEIEFFSVLHGRCKCISRTLNCASGCLLLSYCTSNTGTCMSGVLNYFFIGAKLL